MKLIKNIKTLICAAVISLLFTGCLSGNDSETVVTNYFNVIVTSFSLEDNANVTNDLSKYEFTIDNYGLSDTDIHKKFPNDGIIFNADSLPYGTIADSIKVNVSYSQPDSAFFCLYSLDNKLRQFSNVSADSALFFASFPDVRLNISARGNRKVYHVKINVHKVDGDTIKWQGYSDELWSGVQISDQRTDTIGRTAYWFVENGTSNKVITTDISKRPFRWTEPADVIVASGELLDLQTLYNWHNALYAIGKTSGKLLSSDDGYNWQPVNDDLQFISILGNQLATRDVYGKLNKDSLNAIVRYDDAYHFAVSADAKEWRIDKTIPSEFPIKGFTRPLSVGARSNNGNITSRLYLVGGILADGRLSSSTWSCEGFNEDEKCCNWAEFPHASILPAMQGGSIIEYTLNSDNPKSFWILQPGMNANGEIAQVARYGRNYATFYYSEDNGVSWQRLDNNYPKMADNSGFSDRVSNSCVVNPDNFEIYNFGGKKADGSFSTQVWGGQLPSLTFTKVR